MPLVSLSSLHRRMELDTQAGPQRPAATNADKPAHDAPRLGSTDKLSAHPDPNTPGAGQQLYGMRPGWSHPEKSIRLPEKGHQSATKPSTMRDQYSRYPELLPPSRPQGLPRIATASRPGAAQRPLSTRPAAPAGPTQPGKADEAAPLRARYQRPTQSALPPRPMASTLPARPAAPRPPEPANRKGVRDTAYSELTRQSDKQTDRLHRLGHEPQLNKERILKSFDDHADVYRAAQQRKFAAATAADSSGTKAGKRVLFSLKRQAQELNLSFDRFRLGRKVDSSQHDLSMTHDENNRYY